MSPRQARIGVDLLTALVVASVGVALAGLSWRLAGAPPPGAGAPPGPQATATRTPPPAVAPIIAFAPFGTPAAVSTPQASASALVLRGIMLTDPRIRSTAMIADGGTTRAFAIGETLPGGAVVDAIAIDHVVLRVGGGTEMLGFKRAPAANSAGVAAIRALIPPNALGLPASSPAASEPPPPNAGPAPVSGIEGVRDRIAANPQSFLDSMGATATTGGYRIGAALSPEMRRAGLVPGDVIERVNGVPVGDVEGDRRLFESAVASGRARVDVLREGRRMTLSFPLR